MRFLLRYSLRKKHCPTADWSVLPLSKFWLHGFADAAVVIKPYHLPDLIAKMRRAVIARRAEHREDDDQ